MFLFLFFGLWNAAAALKAAAVLRMWGNGLILRYPLVAASLLIGAIRSVTLAYFYRDSATYKVLYATSEPFILLLEGAVIVEIFWALAENYPNIQRPGRRLLAATSILAATASYLTSSVAVPANWWVAWRLEWWIAIAVVGKRYASLAMVIMLGLTWFLLPKVKGVPIRRSATRAASIVAFQVLSWLATSTLSVRFGPTLFSYFAPLVTGVVVASSWLFWLAPASDLCEPAAPPTDAECSEYLAIQNLHGSAAQSQMRLRIAALMRAHFSGPERGGTPHQ